MAAHFLLRVGRDGKRNRIGDAREHEPDKRQHHQHQRHSKHHPVQKADFDIICCLDKADGEGIGRRADHRRHAAQRSPERQSQKNRHVKIIQLFRSQTRQMLAHHAGDGNGNRKQHKCGGSVGNPHARDRGNAHQYSHKIACLRANKAQEPIGRPNVQSAPLNGQRKHKAAKQQKSDRMCIAARGLRHRHNVERGQQNNRR